MAPIDERELEHTEPLPSRSTRPARSNVSDRSSGGSPALWIGGAALLIAILAIFAWRASRSVATPDAMPPSAAAPEAEAAPAAPAAAQPTAIVLPRLDVSDAVVRELAGALSAHPRLAAWLANDELVRRFVAAVVNVSEGTSPAPHLRFLTPTEGFRVRSTTLGTFVDPASYRRYDGATETFVSLDSAGCARLYREIHPLLDAAYAEQGYPGRTFDETLARAVANILSVRFPDAPLAVRLKVTTYELEDPALEGSSALTRHLLRLGPENLARVQSKLGELARVTKLPGFER